MAAAVGLAVLVYGYAVGEREAMMSPINDGTTSSMIGSAPDGGLTLSVLTPGAADTTTTESTHVPTEAIR